MASERGSGELTAQAGVSAGPTVDPSRFRGSDDPFEGHWREFPAPWPSTEDEHVAARVRAHVASVLGRLPSRQQVVLTLRDIEGFNSDETSSIVEISEVEQRVLLQRARAFVRAELENHFDVDDPKDPAAAEDRHRSLRRRMLPLYAAAGLQGVGLWVPVEKLFMSEIGFTPATIGVMAAAYAAVVPIIEVPSGILADRWSRRGVLIIASAALATSALVGGLSTNVATYIVAALVLGVYFAMYSGTMESIVYDTVLEETGDSTVFQRRLGRVRVVEGSALVSSSLVGGWTAELTSTRLTYFLTVPFVAGSIVLYLTFREPRLHQATRATSLRNQVTVTYRTITRRGVVLPIVTAAVLTSLILQVLFEFGPLWLVAISAAALWYGPFWAALVSTLGLGGLLAGRLRLDRLGPVLTITVIMLLASVALTVSRHLAVVTAAQVLLALLIVVANIHVTGQLHDAVPSSIRSGVASGVGALSWIAFLPFALVFGLLSNTLGVHSAAWLITATVVMAGVILGRLAFRARPHRNLADLLHRYADGTLDAAAERRAAAHLASCGACRAHVEQMRKTISMLGDLPTEPLPDQTRDALLSSLRSRTSRVPVAPGETAEIVNALDRTQT
jgi:MFS family permease